MTIKNSILKIHKVIQITGLSRDEINQKINNGIFPKPFKYRKQTAWLESQIEDWQQKQHWQTKLKKWNDVVSLGALFLKIYDIIKDMDWF